MSGPNPRFPGRKSSRKRVHDVLMVFFALAVAMTFAAFLTGLFVGPRILAGSLVYAGLAVAFRVAASRFRG